ncbi:hypothetical protein CEY00_Acc23228 [Actinidia chinensis var. chinensis]|uniref:Uncharacterized protein n=1 Tax=Actinidia chinensis var. chinensis TaxID=1590841 RepID=A0A2R6Q592_ACTCC|nr:hypothetical protein CEY00_Acc23228 [Actinidia chinensis var. chinensis]
MASNGRITVTTTSPKGSGGKGSDAIRSPKGGGQCLCSPTTHQGSFRCRFHRSTSTTTAWFKRSNSMPSDNSKDTSLSLAPNSVEST